MVSRACVSSASRLAHSTTRAPSCAKPRAVAKPIPSLEPVTMAILPRRPKFIFSFAILIHSFHCRDIGQLHKKVRSLRHNHDLNFLRQLVDHLVLDKQRRQRRRQSLVGQRFFLSPCQEASPSPFSVSTRCCADNLAAETNCSCSSAFCVAICLFSMDCLKAALKSTLSSSKSIIWIDTVKVQLRVVAAPPAGSFLGWVQC